MPARTYDVIVVGGGLVGCSITYQLSLAGKSVLLLEQRDICSGASGRNGGMTGEGSALHATAGRAVYDLTSENLRMLGDLSRILDTDFELRLPGTLDVATTPEQLHHLQEAVSQQKAAGLEVDLLDAHEARKRQPALAPDILGAKFAEGHGHLWPFGLVFGFAREATRLGAEIRTRTPITGLLRQADRVRGVVTESGESIEAETVVLATNAYTPLLLDELPAGAIVPARGQILVTQPMPPILKHPFGTNFDKEYGRQVPGGPILCGGYRRLDDQEGLGLYREEVTVPVLAGIARCLSTLYPVLADIQVVRAWAGIMGFTADGIPLIGAMDADQRLIVAAGFNGGGFSWGAVVGKVVAALIGGEKIPYDLDPFDPRRFENGAVGWSNPFTAGEKSHKVASAAA